MIKLKGHTIHTEAFLAFTALFILFTPIGTVSHEFGHMAVGELYGLQTKLHYQSASHEKSPLEQILNDLYTKNKEAIINDEDYPDKEKFERYYEEYNRQNFWISAGGPIQTCRQASSACWCFISERQGYKSKLSKLVDPFLIIITYLWVFFLYTSLKFLALALLGPKILPCLKKKS